MKKRNHRHSKKRRSFRPLHVILILLLFAGSSVVYWQWDSIKSYANSESSSISNSQNNDNLLKSRSMADTLVPADVPLGKQFIRISKTHPRYFETENGTPWIPVEINFPLFKNNAPDDVIFKEMEIFFKRFSQYGGNSIRIWGGPSDFLEVEDKEIGRYNPVKTQRFATILKIASKYNIRIKFCLEISRNFVRSVSPFYKKHYSENAGGPFSSFADYIDSPEGRSYYLNRVKVYTKAFKNNPTIYDWEVWNEMNAISGGDWYSFSDAMLDSMKLLAPKQLSSQTLGSLDAPAMANNYLKYLELKNNDIICVHRYLDPGAKLSIVYGPQDVSLSDAVSFISKSVSLKPLFVNETGAVTANHAAKSDDYLLDSEGVLLHDMLFAPFFSGAAGPGSAWHFWEYITKFNLWYHYARFTHAISNINPVNEKFTPFRKVASQVNFYGLAGKNTTLVWCRDAKSNYRTEIEQGIKPLIRKNIHVPLKQLSSKKFISAKAYDPWADKWTNLTIVNNTITMPNFLRSVVIKLFNN